MKKGWIFYTGITLLVLSLISFWLGDNVNDIFTEIAVYMLAFTIASRLLLLLVEIIKSHKKK